MSVSQKNVMLENRMEETWSMHFSMLTRMKGTGQNAVLYTSDAGDVTSLDICFSLCTLELGEVKLEASILFTSQNGECVS